MENLKNSLFSLLLNSSNPSQILTNNQAQAWVEEIWDDNTCTLYPALRLNDHFYTLTPAQQTATLRSFINQLS